MNNIDFKNYLYGKVKLDKACDILVEDIKQNKKEDFLLKWEDFKERFKNIENLNIVKIWSALIEYEAIEWFENPPFNKSCHAVLFAAKKYYNDNNAENKKILMLCFNAMKALGKQSIFKDFESLKNHVVLSFYTDNEEKCENYAKVILEIDKLYRSLNPQNPDKFLTYMIISQGKEIQVKNTNEPLSNSLFFNEVTLNLIEHLAEIDGMGANKLKNKKDSQSLNEIYHFFQKYYQYMQFEKMLTRFPNKAETDKIKKMKI